MSLVIIAPTFALADAVRLEHGGRKLDTITLTNDIHCRGRTFGESDRFVVVEPHLLRHREQLLASIVPCNPPEWVAETIRG